MALQIINGPFIQPGEALSEAIDVSAGALVRLTMPGNWTLADLTFQISSDGVYFNDLYDYHGHEIAIPVTPGVGVIFGRDMMAGIGFIRFRSGTAQTPVTQPEVREFSVALLVDGPLIPGGETATATAKGRRKTPRKTAKPRRHK